MIHLRLFGGQDLRDPAGAEILSVLAQPKRFALLAYLTIEGRHGPRRRDELLALFWPELEDARARAALNNSLYYLRRSLGEGVVVNRGSEEVGIAAGRLWCDVLAFEEALEAGRTEEALELYRGDLLEAFFISEAPEWERWLDQRRLRLRERARAAAWALVERCEEVGALGDAVRWTRWWLSRAPEDERALRKLLSLLDRAGDRAGALGEYESFARRLQEVYGTPPSPETRALADALRNPPRIDMARVQVEAPVEAAPPVHTAPEPALPPHPGRRNRVPRHAPLVVSVLLLGVIALVSVFRTASPSPSSSGSVAVLPFEFHGSEEYAYLREGLVTLVSANLNGLGDLQTVSPRAVLNGLARSGDAPPTPTRAGELADRLGARLFVLGNITEAGGKLRVTATLHDRRAPGNRPVQVVVEGEAERLFALADELTTRLTAGLVSGLDEGSVRSAARTTSSIPALEAYLEGEKEFRGARYAAAVEAFSRAVRADSTFALALLRLSNAANWTGEGGLVNWAGKEAMRLRDRLPPHDRLRVEAWDAYLRRSAQETERRYRALLAEDPADAEAWFYLAEVLYHNGPTHGRPAAESRPAWESVLSLQPHDAGALIHLARLMAGQGDQDAFRSLAKRITRLDPAGERALEVRAVGAFAFGHRAEREAIARELGEGKGGALLRTIVTNAAVFSSDLDGAAELLSPLLIGFTPNPSELALDYLLRAEFEIGRGRLRAAEVAIDSAAALYPARATEYRAMMYTLPLVATPSGTLQTLRQDLARPVSRIAWHSRTFPWRNYLLGLVELRMGDSAAASRHALELERFRHPVPGEIAFAREFARLLRAEIARAAGKPDEALVLLGTPHQEPENTPLTVLSYPKAHERWLRAELLRELGQNAEALRIYASFPDPAGYDLMYLAPSHLRRAEILERMGQRQEAARHYARFVELWEDADPELQSQVRDAERKLAQLGGKAASK